MRIQHNIMAMNAYRNYNNNTKGLSSNLEKLSSGYKINRAGDDAAGLAISEKMRAQITGLSAAQKNVKDGISLVKTAEGAMQEVQDMLNRMDYLATQSANGTYDNEVDRAALQKEVDQLKTEINRIADSANFNGIKLLNGDLAVKDAVKAGTTVTTEDVTGMDRIITSVLGKGETASVEAGKKTILDDVAGATKAVKASFAIDLGTLNFNVTGASGSSVSFSVTLTIGGKDITVSASASVGAAASVVAANIAKAVGSAVGSKGIEINGVKWTASVSGTTVSFKQMNAPNTQEEARANFDVNIKINGNGGGLVIKAPANSTGGNNEISMSASLNAGTYVKTPGVALSDVNKANTVFNIKESDIKDGTQIAIGTKTIVLKVGNSSITSAEAAKLSKAGATIVTIGANDNLFTALSKISNAIGSTVNFKTASGTKVSFKIGVSDGSNGNVVGLAVQRVSNATSVDEAFTSLEDLANNFAMRVKTTTTTEAKEATDGLTLQIGDTSDSFNQMKVVIGDMHTTGMGIDGINIANQEDAAAAVQTIKDAINYVSGIRGDLGAIQNRLEHTGNNLSVMAENIQDAESTIRDTDVAEEMMSYVKNNILVQSAQAMLAQANQVPQGVLQLLG